MQQIPDHVRVHRTNAKHPIEWMQRAKRWLRQEKPQLKIEPTTVQISTAPTRTNDEPSARRATTDSLFQHAKDAVTLPWMTPDRWIGWLPFAVRKGKRLLKNKPVSVIYSSGPPWTNHLVAERLHRATETPWVADFRDPWLGNNFRPQREGENWVGRRHQKLERRVIESADIVIVNTDRALEVVRLRYPELSKEKFQVIPNGFDPSDFAPTSQTDYQETTNGATAYDAGSPLRIVHTGAFYGKRNVDALLHAVGDLIADGRLKRSDLQIELIGAARGERTRESDIAVAREIAEIVRILPRMPHDQCLQEMRQTDILLLVQTEAPLCVPGKLYEYIAVGKPILTLAAAGATADIVTNENLGPCIDPADTEALKDCLCQLVKQHQEGTLPQPSGSAVDRFDGRGLMSLFDAAFKTAMERPRAAAQTSPTHCHDQYRLRCSQPASWRHRAVRDSNREPTGSGTISRLDHLPGKEWPSSRLA